MGSDVTTRVLLLVSAILAACLIGLAASWSVWSADPRVGKALLTFGAAFGGTLALMITAFNFVMQSDA
ncbi:hypothetical protein [Micromonospora qiuiae]|uniref:hypothetical protein n=1 Tax=Micromonospora qiuiae TaxID=502268 RepID=UPI00194FDA73|nr:hypothetical protein [Micromonospora qiuiae]